MADFPIPCANFKSVFPTKRLCRYLAAKRWPDGFHCPQLRSEGLAASQPNVHTFLCTQCGRRLRSRRTIMHRSHLPLTVCFWPLPDGDAFHACQPCSCKASLAWLL